MFNLFRVIFISTIFSFYVYAEEGKIDINTIASQEAKMEKKHIMIFFHMTRCPYCMKMMGNAFNDEIAKKKMEKDYIFIDINIDDEGIIKYKDFKGTKKDFSKSLAIGYYPTIVFIDKHNEIVYAMKGYRKTTTFNQMLDYITTKSYLETDFAGYLFDLEE